MPDANRTSTPSKNRAAVSSVMRENTLDALATLLTERNWRTVTMNDVAAAAGLSRQSLYNEFGSRRGLAQGYATRLTDLFVSVVDAALYEHENDAQSALMQGFSAFFALSNLDPLVRSLHTGEAPEDLLRLITTDSDFLIDRAGERLAETFQRGWIGADAREADVISKAIVRLALSYIPKPPGDTHTAAEDLAFLLTPFIVNITTA